MSYLNKYQWEIVPENLPIVKRSCPKCTEKTNYISSEKFRINANKNTIDIWLIYKCEKCKSTWNMTIYERIKPCNISKDEYEKFLSNDSELAREYAFNSSIYSKNKAEVILDNINYRVVQRKLEACYIKENEQLVVVVVCKYPIELRLDKLLSDVFGISRSKSKGMLKEEVVFINNKNTSNIKVRDGMEIHVLTAAGKLEITEDIV